MVKNTTIDFSTVSTWLQVGGVKTPNDSVMKSTAFFLEEVTEMMIAAGKGAEWKDLLVKEVQELDYKDLPSTVNKQEVLDGAADTLVTLGNIFHSLGITDKIGTVYERVMESNFSKYCTDEEEAKVTVKMYLEGTHPTKVGKKIRTYYIQEKVEDKVLFIVKAEENDKILKSYKYKEPDFSNLL